MVALFSFYLANLGVGLRALVYVVCLLLRLLPRTLTNKADKLFFFGEVRLLRMFKELWLICAGLMESIKTLGWVGLLLFIWVYIFAIFTTQVRSYYRLKKKVPFFADFVENFSGISLQFRYNFADITFYFLHM